MQANQVCGCHPATLTEAYAIRAAAGVTTTGANAFELIRGTLNRYGWHATEVDSAHLLGALTVGHSATVGGNPDNLPIGNIFRKYVGSLYHGGHQVYIQRESTSVFWMLDPEAPSGVGYVGNAVNAVDIATFMKGNFGGNTVAPLRVVTPIVPTKKCLCTGPIRETPHDNAKILLTVTAGQFVSIIGTVPGDKYNIVCNGAKSGTNWYHVGRGSVHGYMPVERF